MNGYLCNEFFESFSNREMSVIVWAIVFLSILIFRSKEYIKPLLKALFSKHLVILYLLITSYLAAVVVWLSKINIWQPALYKDFLMWFFTVGMIMIFNLNKLKTYADFVKIIVKLFSLSIVLEFVIGYFTFSLFTELLIVPIFTIISVSAVYADYHKEREGYAKVSKLLKAILSFIGVMAMVYVLYRVIKSYDELLTWYNLKSLLLFPAFTLIFLPLVYLTVVYSKYENIFILLKKYRFIDEYRKAKIKRAIFFYANLNLIYLDNAKHIMIFDKKQLEREQDVRSYLKREIRKRSNNTEI